MPDIVQLFVAFRRLQRLHCFFSVCFSEVRVADEHAHDRLRIIAVGTLILCLCLSLQNFQSLRNQPFARWDCGGLGFAGCPYMQVSVYKLCSATEAEDLDDQLRITPVAIQRMDCRLTQLLYARLRSIGTEVPET